MLWQIICRLWGNLFELQQCIVLFIAHILSFADKAVMSMVPHMLRKCGGAFLCWMRSYCRLQSLCFRKISGVTGATRAAAKQGIFVLNAKILPCANSLSSENIRGNGCYTCCSKAGVSLCWMRKYYHVQILCLRKISGVTGATRAASKQGFLCAEYENIAMCKVFVFGKYQW